MSHRNLIRALVAVAFAVSFAAGVALAGDSAGDKETIRNRPFEVRIQKGESNGWEQTRRVFVSCGTNEFVFVAPSGLRIEADPERVTVAPADFTFFLLFRILSTPMTDLNSENGGFWRALVLKRFPGAQVVEEYPKTAAGRNGLAFDLRVKTDGDVERAVCVVLIPSPVGVLEFTLNADAVKLADARSAFNMVLRTVRSSEGAILESLPHGDNES